MIPHPYTVDGPPELLERMRAIAGGDRARRQRFTVSGIDFETLVTLSPLSRR